MRRPEDRVMKRWLLIALLLAPFGLALGVAVFRPPPKPGVTPENFRRLHKGMSQAEVEAILGESADVVTPTSKCTVHWWFRPEFAVCIHYSSTPGKGVEGGIIGRGSKGLRMRDRLALPDWLAGLFRQEPEPIPY
jgi:hypothetical protein